MTDKQIENWIRKMQTACNKSALDSDINIIKLIQHIEDLYEQGRADEREACTTAIRARSKHVDFTLLQQALDALEFPHDSEWSNKAKAIEALQNALTQPEQERMIQFKDGTMSYVDKPWVGLTDEETNKSWEWAQKSSPYGVTRIETFAKSIEAKLKEKNT